MSIFLHNLSVNKAAPLVMHVDLNSCFASIEQQANRLLRGRPVGVAAYDTPRGFVLAASYQAKAMGVKLGVNVAQARQMCPGIIIMTPDPTKYREAHRRFKEIMLEYTDDVTPKSIDEFVLHLDNSPVLRSGWTMQQIGEDMKAKIREHLGEAVTVNIGIGPNRFLAKFAAGFNKPDGMRQIDYHNLRSVYKEVELVDLPGINVRYKRRLRMYGINTPLDFLAADRRRLEKLVFGGITGYYWYLRLRGYEVDKYDTVRRSIGHQYALPKPTWDRKELSRLLAKLCEKVGRRLRRSGLTAGGIHLYLNFHNYQQAGRDNGFIGGDNLESGRSWHQGHKVGSRLYSGGSIYRASKVLLERADISGKVRGMSITVYDLRPSNPEQLSLFKAELGMTSEDIKSVKGLGADRHVSDALDEINDRYGEFVITPATMMDMQGEILDRVAFGSIKDI